MLLAELMRQTSTPDNYTDRRQSSGDPIAKSASLAPSRASPSGSPLTAPVESVGGGVQVGGDPIELGEGAQVRQNPLFPFGFRSVSVWSVFDLRSIYVGFQFGLASMLWPYCHRPNLSLIS